MPFYQFDDVDVVINGSGILAESASLSQQVAPSQVKSLGYNGVLGATPSQNVSNTLVLNYYLDTRKDYGLDYIAYLRSGGCYSQIPDKTYIALAGVTGEYYLANLSLRGSPGEPIKISSSYVGFVDVTGSIQNKTNAINYGYLAQSGLANGNSLFITNPSNYLTNHTIYDFEYGFRGDWRPEYSIGSKNPAQIQFLAGNEQTSFYTDTWSKIQVSGQEVTGYFGIGSSLSRVSIYGLGYLNGNTSFLTTIDLSGMKITNNAEEIRTQDIVRIKIAAERQF